ncbi:hypothetical protein O6H91_07G094600 [Diphasiastrum complanatum]|uniref:Uncharacterized protein n=1 Tax=Diphasiastrum complanatum TaxID=34168 RepID=A0ACC2D7R0_DIPCM|nr:hypothetical protein O6H91_07G094600 [Diphasiastrum complanatum]
MDTQSLVVGSSEMEVDSKFFTKLCTLFVASMVEAKEYITQLEMMFCGRLYPTFVSELSKSREALENLQKSQEKAREKWQDEKIGFLLDIDRLKKSNAADKRLKEELEKVKLMLKEQEGLEDRHKKETEELRLGHGGLIKEKENLERRLDESLHGNEELSLCNKRLCDEKEELSQTHTKLCKETEALQNSYQKLSEDLDELRWRFLNAVKKQSTTHRAHQSACLDVQEACKKLQNEKEVCKDLYDELKEINDKPERDRLESARLRIDLEKEQSEKQILLTKLRVMKKKYHNIRVQYDSILRRQVVASLSTKKKNIGYRICKTSEDDELTEPVKKKFRSTENRGCFDSQRDLNDANACRPNSGCQSRDGELATISGSPKVQDLDNDSGTKVENPLSHRRSVTDRIDPMEEITLETCTRTATEGEKLAASFDFVASEKPSPKTDSLTCSSHEASHLTAARANDGSITRSSSNSAKKGNTIRDLFDDQGRISIASSTERTIMADRMKPTWRNTRSASGDGKLDLHDDFLSTPHELACQALAGKVAISNDNGSAEPAVRPSPTVEVEIENSFPIDYKSSFADGPAFVPDSLSVEAENDMHAIARGSNASKSIPISTMEKACQSFAETEAMRATITGTNPSKCNLSSAMDNANQSSSTTRLKNDQPKTGLVSPVQPKPPGRSYKFVESVRKKSERESLQGVECKQCKKFYDAVLAEDAQGVMTSRCEHHDGVSRHRYRYVPPATPDGFWNIGFDSDL